MPDTMPEKMSAYMPETMPEKMPKNVRVYAGRSVRINVYIDTDTKSHTFIFYIYIYPMYTSRLSLSETMSAQCVGVNHSKKVILRKKHGSVELT